ncbi:MAG: hypothetical protein Q9163_001637 [Psora crenata]
MAGLASSSSADGKSRPYMAHLESLAQGWPHISYLADFMRVTTSPPRLRGLKPEDQMERASRTKVACLTWDANGAVSRSDFVQIDSLTGFLADSVKDKENVYARLFVVEDLSRDVIEALGTRFDIDPSFFRSHIADYMWYNTRDPWVELPDLDLTSRKRSYLHVRYVQTRYFRSEESLVKARQEAANFNVLRRVDKDGNWVAGVDTAGSDVGLVRSRTSLWIRPNKNGETGLIGILLVDPTISEGYPMWGGYRSLDECPSMNTNPLPGAPSRTSVFEDTIYWTTSLKREELANLASDPRILLKKKLYIICSEWYTLVKYATTRVTQLEWELENPDFQHHAGGLDVTIKKLHVWRRRFPIFRTLVSEVLAKVIKRDGFMGCVENHLIELRCDFEILLTDIENLQIRADRIMGVVTAVMSIEESKKAFQQTRSLARLTWLAMTFVPLSFVATLFSMNSNLTTLSKTLWLYVVIAVPLTALVLVVTVCSMAVNLTPIKENFKKRIRRRGG